MRSCPGPELYVDAIRKIANLVVVREHIRAGDRNLTVMARRSPNESELAEISREMRARRVNPETF